tara:strand:- start:7087 stop:7806 length:720 start_codon:yes stop_codon:yes gene_type:complete
MSKGYIYVAANNVGGIKSTDYIKEAIFSAKSLRKHDPEAQITLFTNQDIKDDVFNEIKIVKMDLRCKQNFLLDSPYEKTILLDTDTYVNHNINDLFDLLEKYEMVGCNDYSRKRILSIPEYMNIPYGFSELNTGVIGYKKCKNFQKFNELWIHYYKKYKQKTPWDQPSCRIALWESDINLYILPSEYNRRGKHTKEKCINARINGDSRFDKYHLKTRIFHYHGLDKLSEQEKEDKAQHF